VRTEEAATAGPGAGRGDGFYTPLDLEFIEDSAVVALECIEGDEKPFPDLVVGEPLSEESEGLELALAERLEESFLEAGGGGQ
jgi:hypothetical protein